MEFKNDTINEMVTGAYSGAALGFITGTFGGVILYCNPLVTTDLMKFIGIIIILIVSGMFCGSIINISLPFAHYKQFPVKKNPMGESLFKEE